MWGGVFCAEIAEAMRSQRFLGLEFRGFSRRCAAWLRDGTSATRAAPKLRALLCDLIISAISAHKTANEPARTVPVERRAAHATLAAREPKLIPLHLGIHIW
jgi:hypothetical protein